MVSGRTTQKDTQKEKFVFLYDTTLRDGTQRKGLSLSLEDKLKIAYLLDKFGVSYIEGGWPGSNPKDMEFFKRLSKNPPKNATVVAFGSTRRVGIKPCNDLNLRALLEAGTKAVALVGKASTLHVTEVLGTDLQENLNMIADSVAYMKEHGKEVIFDAEHFFDGYRANPEYALQTVKTAADAGADWVVLCDTNGGSLPGWVSQVVSQVFTEVGDKVGVHVHNDGELAVANSLAAVEAGARHVQGTVNGYGERCGNANLISIVPNLQLKMGYTCVSDASIKLLTEVSRTVSEIANLNPDTHAPYVGASAFAHKGGLHVAAVEKLTSSYEHIDPSVVGNTRQIVVSELSGRGNIRMLATDLGVRISGSEANVLGQVKELEGKGYQFEDAEGTVELMMRRCNPEYSAPFEKLDMMVVVSDRVATGMTAEAVVKLRVNGETVHTAAEGGGPVHALDQALRKALLPAYPQLHEVRLADYKVRILDPDQATDATTRVVIEAACGEERWSTVGCSQNIIEASCQALMDALELFLLRQEDRSAESALPEKGSSVALDGVAEVARSQAVNVRANASASKAADKANKATKVSPNSAASAAASVSTKLTASVTGKVVTKQEVVA
ncbi:MAG: citramalate synthase [Candidatus Obscuribacterales bacterium]